MNRSDFSARNKFVSQTFDRLSLKRDDDTWLQAQLAGDALVLPVWRRRVSADSDGELRLVKARELDPAARDAAVLLGNWHDVPVFAVDMGSGETSPEVLGDTPFQSLRSIGALASEDSAALAAYGLAMVFWRRHHRFCGVCGSPVHATHSGHVLVCADGDCRQKQFPRSDPAIIVLVSHGERALLGRQAGWPAGVYSTIAGFVEPGESLENAVRREVLEETGVAVGAVRYHSSQPWPFPASLMLGFHAEADSDAIERLDGELEDVRWFDRKDIVTEINEGSLALSARISIAYRLIEHWFDDGRPGTLRTLLADRSR